MIAVLSDLVTGDLEATASMFLSLYRVAPQEAIPVLELLLAGDHQNLRTLSRLLNQLSTAEPFTAFSILRSLGGLKVTGDVTTRAHRVW